MFDLTGMFTTAGPEAVVQYQGLNRRPEPVFVAHLPVDVTLKPYPNSAYAALSADGQRLNLILGTSPLPIDRDVEYGVSALFIKVSPGAQVRGEVRLPVPVKEWNAYFLPIEEVEADLVSVRQIVLTVDVIPQSTATRVQAAKDPPDHWWVVGQAIQSTLLLTLDIALPVRKRSGNFPRS
ncbi:MAG: hypothetical protein L0Z62_49770 [Gemmataceae bacterium]|nr:hypothetical protein [Gemmataceae bacterium]